MSSEGNGSERRRRLSSEQRRELIEAAATELFATVGYRGASIEAIAQRSGVTPPVVYDHFESKRQLYRELLERNFAGLRQIWRSQLAGDETLQQRLARSVDAWFAYMEEHRFAARLLFREPAADPDTLAVHRDVAERSRAAVMTLFTAEEGSENLAGLLDPPGLEMAWEVLRGVLQGLALWWSEHPEAPRERLVATAMNSLWIGFERVREGEAWLPAGGKVSPGSA